MVQKRVQIWLKTHIIRCINIDIAQKASIKLGIMYSANGESRIGKKNRVVIIEPKMSFLLVDYEVPIW